MISENDDFVPQNLNASMEDTKPLKAHPPLKLEDFEDSDQPIEHNNNQKTTNVTPPKVFIDEIESKNEGEEDWALFKAEKEKFRAKQAAFEKEVAAFKTERKAFLEKVKELEHNHKNGSTIKQAPSDYEQVIHSLQVQVAKYKRKNKKKTLLLAKLAEEKNPNSYLQQKIISASLTQPTKPTKVVIKKELDDWDTLTEELVYSRLNQIKVNSRHPLTKENGTTASSRPRKSTSSKRNSVVKSKHASNTLSTPARVGGKGSTSSKKKKEPSVDLRSVYSSSPLINEDANPENTEGKLEKQEKKKQSKTSKQNESPPIVKTLHAEEPFNIPAAAQSKQFIDD